MCDAGVTDDETEGRPGSYGVKLFKDENYVEAILEFSKYLGTNPDERERKTAHYNRGMSHNMLEQHKEALEDGENCVRIDPFWAKGYKCKAVALEGLDRPGEALDILLNGRKLTIGVDKNTTKILDPLIKLLNKHKGVIKQDLSVRERMAKEKFCVVCNLFENDLKSVSFPKITGCKGIKDEDTKFVTCSKCGMISYCCEGHKKENAANHTEVCGTLRKVKEKRDKATGIHVRWKDWNNDAIFFISQDIEERDELTEGYAGVAIETFSAINKTEWNELKSWEHWFSLSSNAEMWTQIGSLSLDGALHHELSSDEKKALFEDVTNDVREALTEALTDPMTVFYAMKQAGLLTTDRSDKIIRLHVVGAEPRHEIKKGKAFFHLLTSLVGPNLRVVLIGPLLSSSKTTEADPLISTFGGTYQEFLKSGNHPVPDCIVAFCPGLYVRQYNWSPVLQHIIENNVPFLATCSANKDYYHTKSWLLNRDGMTPDIVLDGRNPFASWKVDPLLAKSNIIFSRNMYCVLMIGGQLG